MYRPDSVRLLLIAQMPPDDLDRYFYFPTVPTADYLFQAVVPHLLGEEPTRHDKSRQLAALRDQGIFVIDVKPDPCDPAPLEAFVGDLVERAMALAPAHAILIKVDVYDAAFEVLRDAGVSAIDARLPFPSTGRQRQFSDGFGKALTVAGIPSQYQQLPARGLPMAGT